MNPLDVYPTPPHWVLCDECHGVTLCPCSGGTVCLKCGANSGTDTTKGTTMSDRKRGTTLTVIDVTTGAVERANKNAPDRVRFTELKPDWTYGVAVAPDGRIYAVCTEGVGWEITPEKPFQVEYRGSWVEDGKTNASWGFITLLEYTFAEVLALIEASTTTVDLADHVRQFGDRLETNFSIFYGILNS